MVARGRFHLIILLSANQPSQISISWILTQRSDLIIGALVGAQETAFACGIAQTESQNRKLTPSQLIEEKFVHSRGDIALLPCGSDGNEGHYGYVHDLVAMPHASARRTSKADRFSPIP